VKSDSNNDNNLSQEDFHILKSLLYLDYSDEQAELLKRFLESGLADNHALKEIKDSYFKPKQRLWEAILYDYLLKQNISTPTSKNKGPDFTIQNNDKVVRVEAIATRFGAQIKPLKKGDNFENGIINEDKYIERWSTGIYDKTGKFKDYIDNKIINDKDICVIAISNTTSTEAFNFYNDHNEKIPRIIEYLYPLTTQQMVTNNNGTKRYGQREHYTKENGSSVPVGVFHKDEYKHISAVLAYNYIGTLGEVKEWVLVHNINANNPLEEGTLNVDQEWVCRTDGVNFTLENLNTKSLDSSS